MAHAVTLVSIQGIDLAPYSVRGLKQTLEPIEAAKQQRRNINGKLVDLSVPQMRRYKTTITCTDQEGPGLTGVWPGLIVAINCLADLGGGSDAITPLILSCVVVGWRTTRDEWGAENGWQLDLEEWGG
jgi:hypothetical protein